MLVNIDCITPDDIMFEGPNPDTYDFEPTCFGHELLDFLFEHFEVTPKSDYAKEHWGGMR